MARVAHVVTEGADVGGVVPPTDKSVIRLGAGEVALRVARFAIVKSTLSVVVMLFPAHRSRGGIGTHTRHAYEARARIPVGELLVATSATVITAPRPYRLAPRNSREGRSLRRNAAHMSLT